jgi:hypothetical protein
MTGRKASLSAAAAMTTLLALVAGCAQGSPSSPATAAPATTGSPASSSTATPQQQTRSCAGHALTITVADNNKSLCVKTGTVVAVYLRGTLSDKWGPIRSSSAVLAPKADPHLTLQVGMTGAALEAIHPGVATISSVRYPCRASASASVATPSAAATQCGTASDFRITLTVESG